MDTDILAGRLEATERSLLELDKRVDALLERMDEWGSSHNPGQLDELTARLATLEAERAKIAEEARLAEAEAREAEAQAEVAQSEEASLEVAEAILNSQPEEEAPAEEAPALEVIEAPEEPESSHDSDSKPSKRRGDWESLGLNQ